jgi:hypothetical protein
MGTMARSSMLNWIVKELSEAANHTRHEQADTVGDAEEIESQPIAQVAAGNHRALFKPFDDSRSNDRRRHFRKSFFMAVDYAALDRESIAFVQDISVGGVFIGTRRQIPVGQNITITFSFPEQACASKAVGEIVRSSPQGVGVKFTAWDQQLEGLINSCVEI